MIKSSKSEALWNLNLQYVWGGDTNNNGYLQ